MYFIPESIPESQNRRQLGLQGLAQFRDTSERQSSLNAILKALRLNPVGGYVKGSSARRQLEAAFESVPQTLACELFEQLRTSGSSLGRLFRYRLDHVTREKMLKILDRKCNEQKKQLLEAQQKLKQLCEEQQKNIERTRTVLKEFDGAVEKICKLHGEDSDPCQKARFELLGAKVKLDDTIRLQRLRCSE